MVHKGGRKCIYLTICRIKHIMVLHILRMMNKYNIEFYVKANGEEPAKEFILSLDAKMKAKFLKILDLLEINGPLIGLPYSKYLQDGIFEIRVKQSTNITRVLYFFTTKRGIIITNGFIKKTQRTPTSEIELAKRYRADYERRCSNE